MVSMVMLTHKLRMTVRTKRQREALGTALEVSRLLYNAGLEERSGAWSKKQLHITFFDQCKGLTELSGDPSVHGLPIALQRWPLKRLDLAFKGFFSRVRKGEKPGFPRFRSGTRWRSFGYSERSGWKLVGRWLLLSRIGRFMLHLHRPLEGEVRSLAVRREGRKWFGLVTFEVANAQDHPGPAVGLDLGLTRLATLSTGEIIANVREGKRRARAIAAATQALARAIRGSKRRARVKERLGRLKRREANARATYLHQQSAALTRRYSTIVVEDLRIKSMMRSARGSREEPGRQVAQKSGLNRSLGDAAWGRFVTFLAYKAERAGGQVIRVNPKNTSNICSRCNGMTPSRIGDEFCCADCGHTIDRDHNAALNILTRGVVIPVAEAA
jgi:putative transposase